MSGNDFYVYIYFRPDGRPCYVGKGRRHRWRKHFGKCHNAHLRAIIERAGGEIPAVKLRDDMSEEAAFAMERALIEAIGREPNGPLVNMSDGGEGPTGRKMTPQQVEKLRIVNTGRKKTPLEIERRAAQIRGRPRPESTKAALLASRKGAKASAETLKKMSEARRGMPWTDAQKRSHKPWSHSPESKRKIGNALKGKKQAPEFVARRIAAVIVANQREDVRANKGAAALAVWAKRKMQNRQEAAQA